jgi:hypothetical protein
MNSNSKTTVSFDSITTTVNSEENMLLQKIDEKRLMHCVYCDILPQDRREYCINLLNSKFTPWSTKITKIEEAVGGCKGKCWPSYTMLAQEADDEAGNASPNGDFQPFMGDDKKLNYKLRCKNFTRWISPKDKQDAYAKNARFYELVKEYVYNDKDISIIDFIEDMNEAEFPTFTKLGFYMQNDRIQFEKGDLRPQEDSRTRMIMSEVFKFLFLKNVGRSKKAWELIAMSKGKTVAATVLFMLKNDAAVKDNLKAAWEKIEDNDEKAKTTVELDRIIKILKDRHNDFNFINIRDNLSQLMKKESEQGLQAMIDYAETVYCN